MKGLLNVELRDPLELQSGFTRPILELLAPWRQGILLQLRKKSCHYSYNGLLSLVLRKPQELQEITCVKDYMLQRCYIECDSNSPNLIKYYS